MQISKNEYLDTYLRKCPFLIPIAEPLLLNRYLCETKVRYDDVPNDTEEDVGDESIHSFSNCKS